MSDVERDQIDKNLMTRAKNKAHTKFMYFKIKF